MAEVPEISLHDLAEAGSVGRVVVTLDEDAGARLVRSLPSQWGVSLAERPEMVLDEIRKRHDGAARAVVELTFRPREGDR